MSDETPKRTRRVERATDTRMVRIRPGHVTDWMHPAPDVTIGRDWAPAPADVVDALVAADPAQVEVRTIDTNPEEE